VSKKTHRHTATKIIPRMVVKKEVAADIKDDPNCTVLNYGAWFSGEWTIREGQGLNLKI
jgi:hypothetical protein